MLINKYLINIMCAFLMLISSTLYSQKIQQNEALKNLKEKLNYSNNEEYLKALVEIGNLYSKRKTRNLDSLNHYASLTIEYSTENKNDTHKIDGLHNLGLYNLFTRNYQEAINLAKEAESESNRINYFLGLVKANKVFAYAYKGLNEPLKYVSHLDNAYIISKSNNLDASVIFDQAVDLSTAYIEYQYSINPTSTILLEVEKLVNDPSISYESKGIFYQNLGSMYLLNGDFEDAIKNYRLSIENFHLDGDSYYLYYPMINLADSVRRFGNLDEAIELLKEAKLLKIPNSYADIHYSMGEIYYELKDYEKSKENFKEAINYYLLRENYNRIGRCHQYLSDIYKNQEDFQKEKNSLNLAISYYDKSIKTNTSKGVNKRSLSDSYLNLAEIYEDQSLYKKSLDNYKLFNTYKDSLYEDKRLRMDERSSFIQELSDQKIKINDLANQNKLQQINSDKQRFLRIGLIVISILLGVLLLVILNRYRLKQKSLHVIKQKNAENKLLMREIHHRVKNNLQIILSLLNTQVNNNSKNNELKMILQESVNRIKSMAIIHQNLYDGDQFSDVSIQKYVSELITQIKKTFTNDFKDIKFITDLVDKQIKIGIAVPLGLVINEIITNSYKHAFYNYKCQENKIKISFSEDEKNATYSLCITDNGKGMPKDFNIKTSKSFGIELVYGLVEQLNGMVTISQKNGTNYKIVIPFEET